ncbi:MAG: TldD/PmbA family protein [Bdellovibrionota bacterium]
MDSEKYLSRWKHEADFVSLSTVREKAMYRRLRNEKLQNVSTALDEGYRIEVMVDGHIGYGCSFDASPEGVERTFRKVLDQTKKSSAHKVFTADLSHRPSPRGQFRSAVQKSLDDLGHKEIFSVLMECSKALKVSDQIVTRSCDSWVIESDMESFSTEGKHTHQNFSIVFLAMSATAQKNGEIQSRSLNGGHALGYQIGSEIFSRHRLLPQCEIVGEQAMELVAAPNCPEGMLDLILAPDQMTLQIHESIGHPLELDRILGDERNYAGWSFVKPADFGELQYGSKLMNVTFDPSRFGQLASYSFDDVGHKAEREFLIKDGKLMRGLGSLESQARSGIPGVANSRSSSWNRPPIDRMANINLEAGPNTMQEIIETCDNGIVMHANRSWSIDDYRRKFQFGCEYGQLIKGGKVMGVVKNPNYRGITVPFWQNLSHVGNITESFGSPFCGKGEPNQAIRVGHASPYARFKNIEVFGGAK